MVATRNLTLEAALTYINWGWSIIPLQPKDKNPYFDALPIKYLPDGTPELNESGNPKHTWENYQNQLPDEKTIREWFRHCPTINIGVVGGLISGIFILDLDDSIAQQNAEKLGLPKTPTALSGKGWHYYFKHPESEYLIKNVKLPQLGTKVVKDEDGKDRPLPLAEIKATGGYVVAPPSTHISGKQYTWDISPEEIEIAQAPDWLADFIREKGGVELINKPEPKPAAIPEIRTTKSKRAQNWLNTVLAKVATTPEGIRNNTLNDYAYVAYGYVAGGEFTESEITNTFEQAGLAAGLKPHEVKATLNSAKKGLNKPLNFEDSHTFNSNNNHQTTQDTAHTLNNYLVEPIKIGNDELPILADQDDYRPYTLNQIFNDEIGDAKVIAALYKNQILFDTATGRWYLWQGINWQEDNRDLIANAVHTELPRQYRALAQTIKNEVDTITKQVEELDPNNEDHQPIIEALTEKVKSLNTQKEALINTAKKLCKGSRVSSVLNLLRTLPDISFAGDTWDQKPFTLPVANGVVDLTNGTLLAGDPKDHLKTACKTEWKGLDTTDSYWEQVLDSIFNGDQKVIKFLQRWVGYGITACNRERQVTFLTGVGANGKDTLLFALQQALGAFVQRVSTDIVMATGRRQSGAASPHIYDLMGKRFTWINETAAGQWINSTQLKDITGGGTIEARAVFGRKIVRFEPTHTLTICTNYLPHAPADDQAFWDRTLVVDFPNRFVDEPKESNERKRDPFIKTRLIEEKSIILAWCVQGAIDYLKQGLNPPASVKERVNEYRESEDMLSQFISEHCEVGEKYESRATPFYEHLRIWYENNGLKAPTAQNLIPRMQKLGFERKRDKQGWSYLKLRISKPVERSYNGFESDGF